MTLGMSNEFLAALRAKAGCHQGSGINHEAQNFTGTLVIRDSFGGALIWFRAQGETGKIFHEEIVLIGAAFSGGLTMTSLNTNIQAAQHFVSETATPTSCSFVSGDLANRQTFRELVTISLEGSAITYAFAWGLPGQTLEDRSTVTMHPISTHPAGCPILSN